ncbi:MAG: YkuS family protein [Peptococcaceae bacterium]
MQKQIAVEPGLKNITQALQTAGYQVVDLEKGQNRNNVQCIVISGGDENMLGIQTTLTKAPVINAEGLTVEEVLQRVQHYH